MNCKRLLLPILVVGLVLTSSQPAKALAPSGITVSPAIETINLNADETSHSFTLNIADFENAPVSINLTAKDFNTLGAANRLNFLNTPDQAHGLASALSFSPNQVSLSPGQSQTVTVSINDVSGLANGGHYTAILSNVSTASAVNGSNPVTIGQSVASLVFLTTASGGTDTISLDKPSFGSLWFTHPKTINLVFNATGNTQTTPRGTVYVLGPNFSVEKAVINTGSDMILPGSARLFQIKLTSFKQSFLPGIYHLKIGYFPDGSSTMQRFSKTFLFVNLWFVLIVVGILLIISVTILRLVKQSRRQRSKTANP